MEPTLGQQIVERHLLGHQLAAEGGQLFGGWKGAGIVVGEQDADLFKQFADGGDVLSGQARGGASEFAIVAVDLSSGEGEEAAQKAQGGGAGDDENLRRSPLTRQQNAGCLGNLAPLSFLRGERGWG
jgi:hypothetical protein